MAPAGAKKDGDKGVGDIASDLWQLVRDYAKQEIISPLGALKRFFLYGVGGAVSLSLGLFFLSMAVLRGLQTQTGPHLTGVLDFVPYAATFVVDLVFVGLAVKAITKPFKADERSA